ncbi:hypothetical protein [Corynebacterium antarcticum]|uniref:hypothetical protein n=1 Tax=Corynebacterium antarcticum TaxID=2800405 RepID=UPI002006678E|nr:hypothetical protein [Corynebacterium antarcticum]MCK7642264.1 hypothetical protein [Corynebacterium antarcticum]MCK7661052.1 hypothetical protein [Corynebacterium antarcticum]MCX7491745.1 hypothetical protein [Corynebacterium antarcticum]MCX7540372.1 hypothetical protein [Corynebacterium antarcticum]
MDTNLPSALRPLPYRRRLCGITAALVCAFTLSGPMTPWAVAYTITADTDRMVCVIDPEEPGSDVVQFWTSLEDDARDLRLAELDEADPGLRAAIEAYDSGATGPDAPAPVDLQRRISDAGGTEGLGMLTTLTAEEAGVVSEPDEHKTEYTEQEAREAATAIGADPGAQVAEALWGQAAAGPRLDEIKAELFTARAEEYNRTQEHLRRSLVDCADELEDTGPLPTWIWALGGAAAAALLAIIAAAIRNSRRPNRHAA